MEQLGRMGRVRVNGRPRPPDALPQPRALRREVREAIARLHAVSLIYGVEHEALVALGGGEVSVTSSPGSLTEATVLDRDQEAARRRCARAVSHLRSAATHVDLALGAFGPLAEQPKRSPGALIDQSTFERAVNRQRHRQREEELRRG